MWVADIRVWQVAPGAPMGSLWPALGLAPSNGVVNVGR